MDAIADAVAAYTGKRTVQREKLAGIETAQLAAQTAEALLEQELWVNACEVVLAYPSHSADDQARRAAAANHSLLVRAGTADETRLTGTVVAGAVLNLLAPGDEEVLQPDTALTFSNPGKVALRFGLMKAATVFDEATALTVAPGETLVRKAAELADVTEAPYLNVQNPNPGVVGAYEVLIG